MINILFLIDRMWGENGGTEGQLLMLYRNLDPGRFKVHLFCLQDTEWLRSSSYRSQITVLGVDRLIGLKGTRSLFWLARYCRANKIDIVQTYFNDSFIFGTITGKLAGVGAIISCRRNLGPGFWNRSYLLRVFRQLRHFTTRYLANSEATKESIIAYEKINPQKVTVIYNGLDLDRFNTVDEGYRREVRQTAGLKDGEIMIVMVSHLRKEKNIPLFLEAARDLTKRYGNLKFMILGSGPLERAIRAEVENSSLRDVMTLPGGVENVIPYLAAADIACLTSDGESYSNAIIEYMAAGLPVAATAVGGNIEALRENGFLFERGNLEQLIGCLSRLIDNRELRLDAGKKSRDEAFRKYSIRRMVTEHEAIYQEIVGEAKKEEQTGTSPLTP